MSGNPSPFIPPLGTPRTPAQNTLSPAGPVPAAWPGPAPQIPAGYPPLGGYPSFSPYANAPFVPGGFTPAPPVNHYFPGTAPPAPHPPLPGVSLDYTGYPSLQPSPWANPASLSHTPAAPPPATLQGGWAGPAADAVASGMHRRVSSGPPAGPPPFSAPQIPTSGGAAYPGMGHPMMWGQPPPPAAPWGSHSAAFTPGPAYPADLWGGGGGGGMGHTPSGWPAPNLPPAGGGGGGGFAPMPLGRATEASIDRVNRFAAGPNYGPVLEPFLVRVVGAKIEINPLLLPPPEDDSRDFLKWNMLFPPNYCQRSSDASHISWSKGRQEPATFPRVTYIRLVCMSMPYSVDVRARNPEIGVTCGEVIDFIAENLQRLSGEAEFRALPPQKQRQLSEAYRHNRSREHGVPGGSLGDGMKRLDWLAQESIFDGVVPNDRLIRQICGELLPCTFQLRCTHRFPMTAREIAEHEDIQRRISEQESEEANRRQEGLERARERAHSRASNMATREGAHSRASNTATREGAHSRTPNMDSRRHSRHTMIESVSDEENP